MAYLFPPRTNWGSVWNSWNTAPPPPKPKTRADIFALHAKDNLPPFSNPSTMVTFLVGDTLEKFQIHKETACHHSPVFARAFNSFFIEGQTQTYGLTDISVCTFRMFMQWLYTSKLHLSSLSKTPSSNEAESEEMLLVELWVLGDRYDIPALQNYVVEMLCEVCIVTEKAPLGVVEFVWDNTSEGSLLRGLVVELISFWSRGDKEKEIFRMGGLMMDVLKEVVLLRTERKQHAVGVWDEVRPWRYFVGVV